MPDDEKELEEQVAEAARKAVEDEIKKEQAGQEGRN